MTDEDCHHRAPGRERVGDEVFSILQHRDRRYALYFLLEHESTTLEELADVVTGWRQATEYGVATRQHRDRTFVDLVHRHVPMMVDAKIVRHDEDAGTVSLEPCPEPTRAFVHLACVIETGATAR